MRYIILAIKTDGDKQQNKNKKQISKTKINLKNKKQKTKINKIRDLVP
jgi:hypothetical protein